MEFCIFQDDVQESFLGAEHRDKAIQAVSETLQYKDPFSVLVRSRRFLPNYSV